jgi:hypothetical protein
LNILYDLLILPLLECYVQYSFSRIYHKRMNYSTTTVGPKVSK